MARIVAVLPLLALLQNVIAFNFPSTRFMTNAILKMSDSDGPGASENAFSPSGYQVFLGNLPFTMDESQLEQLISGKAERYNIFAALHKWRFFIIKCENLHTQEVHLFSIVVWLNCISQKIRELVAAEVSLISTSTTKTVRKRLSPPSQVYYRRQFSCNFTLTCLLSV